MKASLRFAILERDGYRCHYCGRPASEEVQLEVDHINPRANGGTDDEANLITSCVDCNRGKSARVIEMPKTTKSGCVTTVLHPLVGKFFHSFVPCRKCGESAVQWQGYVKAVLPSGTYLVQLFEWGMGEASSQHLVRQEVIDSWRFYDTSKDMNHTYHEVLRHWDCDFADPEFRERVREGYRLNL